MEPRTHTVTHARARHPWREQEREPQQRHRQRERQRRAAADERTSRTSTTWSAPSTATFVVNSTAFESDDMKMGSKLDVELSETSFTAGSAPMIARPQMRSSDWRWRRSGAVCCVLGGGACWWSHRPGPRRRP